MQAAALISDILEYMRSVAVVGIGKTVFGALIGRDLRSLALEAISKALAESTVDTRRVEAFYLGNFAAPSFVGQNHLAPYIGRAAGFGPIPCTRIEDACASGGSAFFHAWQSVASGCYDVVVAAGVEKMTSATTGRVAEILAGAGDMSSEGALGATFPSLFAMIARRHMHEFGTTREQLAAVAVKNHANGFMNPMAHMRKVITLDQALNSRPVCDPLTVFDCSLISDGAAAVVLMPWNSSRGSAKILTAVQTSDHVALDAKATITTFESVKLGAEKAYAAASVGPEDVDLAELHDCFTIAEIIATEDLGFAEKGCGGPLAASGATGMHGRIPVNTSGGLKSKGHPVGATGISQICDLVQLLRDSKHRIGLAQNLGGSGATSVISILEAA